MKTREFVAMAKQYAVDDVVTQVVNELRAPQIPPPREAEPGDVIAQSIQKSIDDHSRTRRERSDWFNGLSEQHQRTLTSILSECAEQSVGNFFALLDGVGGPYEGVFEVVAIDPDDSRTLLNPENDDMLHDVFADVCEGDRRKRHRKPHTTKGAQS